MLKIKKIIFAVLLPILVLVAIALSLVAINYDTFVNRIGNINQRNDFGGFSFEDYQKKDEAEKELLKLHPIGSETKLLLDRFTRIGKYVTKEENKPEITHIIISYKKPQSHFLDIIETQWNIVVTDEGGKISTLSIQENLTGP